MNKIEYHEKLLKIRGLITQPREWPKDLQKIKIIEGKTECYVETDESIYEATSFFNPVMAINRDLTLIAVIAYAKKYNKKMRIIDPLGGIGVRALRLANEANEWISQIIINDFSDVSTSIASYNIHESGLDDTIKLFQREAKSLILDLAENNFKFHYIDLDPFGPPTPFIDTIWSAFAISGLASITATDMTALCGIYPESCLRKYGSIPLNNFHTHETAARILLATIARSASRQEFGIHPLLTVSVDHYCKIFVKVRKSRGLANEAASQIGFSYTCRECFQIYYKSYQESPPTCCGELDKAGPLWIGPLFDKEWCQLFEVTLNEIELPSTKRIAKLLREGIETGDLKGYYALDEIGRKLHSSQPKTQALIDALASQGYRTITTEFRKQSIRTDATTKILMDVFSTLVTKNSD